jgi:hypothetical protein
MNATICLVRDRIDPRIYRLAVVLGHDRPLTREATNLPWNEARRCLRPETFYQHCRMSFADWCARNPELADGR